MECTDMEQRILDMWPKYEDGSYVWFGDAYRDVRRKDTEVDAIMFNCMSIFIEDIEGSSMELNPNERVKRPAPKVLDADGVEIKVGDTVWHHSGFAHGVVTSIDASSLISTVRYSNGYAEFRDAAKDLTHVQPDSWERLEKVRAGSAHG